MEELSDTSSGKSVSVEFTWLAGMVRLRENGNDEGSEMTILYCLDTVTLAPPAVVPVAVMVKFCEPITLVEPLISPFEALMDSPGGSPVAEKDPLPEKLTVWDREISFLPKTSVPVGSFKLIGPVRLPKFR